ncbi:MAG: hypothetical protein KJ620_00090 [Candidatus Edwardsbacteria bacterium]|nr:hypothetical protein [Candidatus Edwardsbacteria bacterium]MBU1577170.1 hypothetical protein [Candidatus Edwardsbacteria bacterium]MBU2593293.1 hypothetical protein [Candidatus Edwardsbacteria bacterium]
MLKKILLSLLAVGIIAVIAIAIFFFFAMRGPDLAKYQYLKDPQISERPNQKMLVVETRGDPNIVGTKAFALLFKAYYKAVKGGKMQIPRARWPQDLGTSLDEWIGQYALPVPESTDKLPDIKIEPGFKITLAEWKYGMVAEILHIGPYSKEAPTIERLKKHAHDNGYYITGLHEEEYLKGPGMFGPGDPGKYQTIIRYRVEKTAVEDTKETKKK